MCRPPYSAAAPVWPRSRPRSTNLRMRYLYLLCPPMLCPTSSMCMGWVYLYGVGVGQHVNWLPLFMWRLTDTFYLCCRCFVIFVEALEWPISGNDTSLNIYRSVHWGLYIEVCFSLPYHCFFLAAGSMRRNSWRASRSVPGEGWSLPIRCLAYRTSWPTRNNETPQVSFPPCVFWGVLPNHRGCVLIETISWYLETMAEAFTMGV